MTDYTYFSSNLADHEQRKDIPLYNWNIEGKHKYDEKLLDKFMKDNPYISALRSTLRSVHVHIDSIADYTLNQFNLVDGIIHADVINSKFIDNTFIKCYLVLNRNNIKHNTPIKFYKCYLHKTNISFQNAVFTNSEIVDCVITGNVKSFYKCELAYTTIHDYSKVEKFTNCNMYLFAGSDEMLKKARNYGNNYNVADVIYINEYRILAFGDGNYMIANQRRGTGGYFNINEDIPVNKIGEYCSKFIKDNIQLIKLLDKEVIYDED